MRVLVLLSLLLSACGQAGDLYLPEAKPAQPEASSAPPAAPAEPSPPTDAPKKDTK